jgi:hypothetical protein
MPVLLDRLTDQTGDHVELAFWCPGCKCNHSYCVQRKAAGDVGPVWEWNGSYEKPTFSPSLLVWGHRPDMRCHLFLTDGMLRFLDDCVHDLKGQTVPMVDFDAM